MTDDLTYDELKQRVSVLEQQNELLQSEASIYRTLFDSFPHGISVSDSQGNIVDANSISEQLLGIHKEEHKKMDIEGYGVVITYSDITERKQAEEALRDKEERLSLALDGGSMGTWDWNIQTDEVDFDERWASMKGYQWDEKRNPLRACGIHLDITENKRAEEDLRESEEKYRLLAETTSDIIVVHDMQGRILFTNQAGRDFYDLQHSELVGASVFDFIPPEYHATLLSRKEQRSLGDAGMHLYEIEFINNAGQRIPIEVNSTPFVHNEPGLQRLSSHGRNRRQPECKP